MDLIELYDQGCKGLADIDMHELLWEILADVQSSYNLAMVNANISVANIREIERTVEDYLVNHYGDA